MYEPQKNIPMPRSIRTNPTARRKYPFEDLEVGGMFFVPGREKNTLSSHVSAVGAKLKRKFSTRLCYMIETKSGWKPAKQETASAILGVGVWRVK